MPGPGTWSEPMMLTDKEVEAVVAILDHLRPDDDPLLTLFRDEQERRYMAARYRQAVGDLVNYAGHSGVNQGPVIDGLIQTLNGKALEGIREWSEARRTSEGGQ